METGNERLFRVLGDVGSDLIATAERKTFAISPWRRILPVAACLVAAIGLTVWGAPYFVRQTQPAASAPVAEETVEEAAPMESVMDAEPQQVPEQPPTAEVQNEAARTNILPKGQLVFWDTVYYVEAKYTLDEAAELLGAGLGTVETADQEALVGANVYTKQSAEVRTDDQERPVPLEIFVELEPGEGYLYCLTYYLEDGPLLEWEAVQARCYAGKVDELAKLFVFGLERNTVLTGGYADSHITADDLTAEQLLAFFQTTLEMEKYFGTRTDDLNNYCWKAEDGYVIPVEDIRRQLDKYLVGYIWQPELLPGYDPGVKAVKLEILAPETADVALQVIPEQCSLDEQSKILYLTVMQDTGSGAGMQRMYYIGFRADRVVYEQIDNVLREE